MRCWAIEHDAHGLSLDNIVFLADGDEPDVEEERWVRVPWLDEK